MKLSKEKWEQLDELLGEIGFGGYYDLTELLKMTITNIKPELANAIENESDLYNLIVLMNVISLKEKL